MGYPGQDHDDLVITRSWLWISWKQKKHAGEWFFNICYRTSLALIVVSLANIQSYVWCIIFLQQLSTSPCCDRGTMMYQYSIATHRVSNDPPPFSVFQKLKEIVSKGTGLLDDTWSEAENLGPGWPVYGPHNLFSVFPIHHSCTWMPSFFSPWGWSINILQLYVTVQLFKKSISIFF